MSCARTQFLIVTLTQLLFRFYSSWKCDAWLCNGHHLCGAHLPDVQNGQLQ